MEGNIGARYMQEIEDTDMAKEEASKKEEKEEKKEEAKSAKKVDIVSEAGWINGHWHQWNTSDAGGAYLYELLDESHIKEVFYSSDTEENGFTIRQIYDTKTRTYTYDSETNTIHIDELVAIDDLTQKEKTYGAKEYTQTDDPNKIHMNYLGTPEQPPYEHNYYRRDPK